MKAMNKFASALRAIGVVLLVLALAMSIYNLATGNSKWQTMAAQLQKNGVSTGIISRLQFDHALFPAMAEVAPDKESTMAVRSAKVREHFEGFVNNVEKKQPEVTQQKIDEVYAYFNNEFDAAAYGNQYAQWLDRQEDREVAAVISALDALSAPAGKAGKKLAKLQVSCDKAMAAAYEELAAAHGEEAGSYLEFLLTVQAMIDQAKAAGETVTGAEAYIKAGLDYEAYKAQLAVVQSTERASEAGILDEFAALAQAKAEGKAADFEAFFQAVYAEMNAKYPDVTAPSYEAFVTSTRKLLDAGSTFDGSYATIQSAAQDAQVELNSGSFTTFIGNFSRDVVKEADGATVFAVLWAVTGNMVWFVVAGVALIIIGIAIKKAVYAKLLHDMEVADVTEDDDILLSVKGLKQYFRAGDYVTKAVDDVNFFVKKGEVFGLVGESGCGKTTTGRTIINLYDPTEGDVYFQGLRISSSQNGLPVLIRSLKNEANAKIEALKEKVKKDPSCKDEVNAEIKAIRAAMNVEIEKARDAALESTVEKSKCVQKYREKRQKELTAEFEQDAKTLTGAALEERKQRYDVEMKVAAKDNIMTRMQMIFQDPIASINPRMTVREIIAEGLIIRGVKDKKYIDEKVYEMLELVGLVREHADRYPHEFSGGQRQRIGIARAIVMQPDLIIADEPISALDVSIQAQVINLMNDLRNRMGLTILFIAHNLSVVKYFSDRIAVMYFGKIVELATSDELFEHPLHPYTKSLLSAIPYPDPHYEKQRQRIVYKPAESHDYSVDKPSMHEITPGHFIYCNEAELARYKKELGL